MPKPRRLSGAELIHIFSQFTFLLDAQKGSHAKLVRHVAGRKQVLVVPMHKEIKTGTVVAIFKQASRFIPETELHEHFYTD